MNKRVSKKMKESAESSADMKWEVNLWGEKRMIQEVRGYWLWRFEGIAFFFRGSGYERFYGPREVLGFLKGAGETLNVGCRISRICYEAEHKGG